MLSWGQAPYPYLIILRNSLKTPTPPLCDYVIYERSLFEIFKRPILRKVFQ